MKQYIFSYFKPPISNKKPDAVCNIQRLHTFITSNPRLKETTHRIRDAPDVKTFRRLKVNLLPYVTPAGVFSYGKAECLVVPSGVFVIDLDGMASHEEACHWRDTLFNDLTLNPTLAFVSPSGKGVKLFVPYRMSPTLTIEQSFTTALHAAWTYLKVAYGLEVDRANSDLARGCLLAHDAEARLRG